MLYTQSFFDDSMEIQDFSAFENADLPAMPEENAETLSLYAKEENATHIPILHYEFFPEEIEEEGITLLEVLPQERANDTDDDFEEDFIDVINWASEDIEGRADGIIDFLEAKGLIGSVSFANIIQQILEFFFDEGDEIPEEIIEDSGFDLADNADDIGIVGSEEGTAQENADTTE